MFMLLCVPLPVCHTTSGKCSSYFPLMMSSHTAAIASAFSLSKLPRRSLAIAVLRFKIANAFTTSFGIFSEPILKFSLLRCVCAPQNLSFGTLISPIVSFSILNSVIMYPSIASSLNSILYKKQKSFKRFQLKFYLYFNFSSI